MTEKPIIHTIITVDIVSQGPYRLASLADLDFDINEGDCAGNYRIESSHQISKATCRSLIEDLGCEVEDYDWAQGDSNEPIPAERDLKEVVEDATQAFFRAISRAYKVKTVDFPPDADFKFTQAATEATKVFLEHNAPEMVGKVGG